MATPYRSAVSVAALYCLASVLWWWLVGRVLNTHFDDDAAVAHWQLVSGYVWAVFSTLLIFTWRARLLRLLRRQQQAGAAGRERLNMAAAVFDSTLEGVLVTDPTSTVAHVNRAFIDITGYAEAEVLGHKPSKFKSGRHPGEFKIANWAKVIGMAGQALLMLLISGYINILKHYF